MKNSQELKAVTDNEKKITWEFASHIVIMPQESKFYEWRQAAL